MIHSRIIKYQSAEYQEMLELRTKVLREPLGLSFPDKDLEAEKDDFFLAICQPQTHKIIACCILTPLDDNQIKLRQMAVDEEWQKQGIGAQMLDVAELVSKEKGFTKVILHARKVAVGFYQKYYYTIVGDEFTEVGIPHFEMEKQLK